MADFTITDSLGNPVDVPQAKWTSTSSMANYAKTGLLHTSSAAPDYIKLRDKLLTTAAPKPVTFTPDRGSRFPDRRHIARSGHYPKREGRN